MAALFLTAGYILIIQAMRVGEISAVGPFRDTIMLWAIILQFTIFGSWPDWLTLAGTAIVVATGVYTFYRERRVVAPFRRPSSSRAMCRRAEAGAWLTCARRMSDARQAGFTLAGRSPTLPYHAHHVAAAR